MPFPDYDIATEFTVAGKVHPVLFSEEVVAGGPYSEDFHGLNIEGGTCSVVFAAVLPSGEQTTIDNLVAAHAGQRVVDRQAPPDVVSPEVVNAAVSFTQIGGVIFDPSDFGDPAQMLIEVSMAVNTQLGGAQVRIVEDDGTPSDAQTLHTENLPITGGSDWDLVTFETPVSLRSGTREYRVESILGAAVVAQTRSLTFRVIERTTEDGLT